MTIYVARYEARYLAGDIGVVEDSPLGSVIGLLYREHIWLEILEFFAYSTLKLRLPAHEFVFKLGLLLDETKLRLGTNNDWLRRRK